MCLDYSTSFWGLDDHPPANGRVCHVAASLGPRCALQAYPGSRGSRGPSISIVFCRLRRPPPVRGHCHIPSRCLHLLNFSADLKLSHLTLTLVGTSKGWLLLIYFSTPVRMEPIPSPPMLSGPKRQSSHFRELPSLRAFRSRCTQLRRQHRTLSAPHRAFLLPRVVVPLLTLLLGCSRAVLFRHCASLWPELSPLKALTSRQLPRPPPHRTMRPASTTRRVSRSNYLAPMRRCTRLDKLIDQRPPTPRFKSLYRTCFLRIKAHV